MKLPKDIKIALRLLDQAKQNIKIALKHLPEDQTALKIEISFNLLSTLDSAVDKIKKLK